MIRARPLRPSPCPRRSTATAPATARRDRTIGRTAPTIRSPPRSIPANAMLSGDETITYTNNSPVALDALWVQLDENIYTARMRAPVLPPAEARRDRRPDHRRLRAGRGGDRRRQPGAQGRLLSSPIPACRSACPRRSKPRRPAQAAHPLSLYRAGGQRRTHRPCANQEWRDLRHRPMVSAHGGVRRSARLGHAALSGVGILSRIWRFRLRRDRALGHAGGGLGRAGQSGRGSDRDRDARAWRRRAPATRP